MKIKHLGSGVVVLAGATCLACGPADPADIAQLDAENVGSTQEQLDFMNLQAALQRQSAAQRLVSNIVKKKSDTQATILQNLK